MGIFLTLIRVSGSFPPRLLNVIYLLAITSLKLNVEYHDYHKNIIIFLVEYLDLLEFKLMCTTLKIYHRSLSENLFTPIGDVFPFLSFYRRCKFLCGTFSRVYISYKRKKTPLIRVNNFLECFTGNSKLNLE